MARSGPGALRAAAAPRSPAGSRLRRRLPSLLSGARLLSAPLLGWWLLAGHPGAVVLLAAAACSDGLDGFLARRWRACSASGAWLDATADLAVVTAGFGALALRGTLPAWLPLLVLGMFAQFALTRGARPAGRAGPVYDPVGKYYGGLLLALLLALLLIGDAMARLAPPIVLALSAATLASRHAPRRRRRAAGDRE